MKPELLAVGILGAAACSSPEQNNSTGTPMATEARHTGSMLRSSASIRLNWGEMSVGAALPVPTKRATLLCFAVFQFQTPNPRAGTSKEELLRLRNEVNVPDQIVYVEATSGLNVEETGYLNEKRPARFGIADPPDGIVGRFDDPNWLPKPRVDELRTRIFAGLDILLPFFADPNRPWTEAANKAAQEVRDFFPLAAEPGLWPYYKAEGKEFFAWVEKNAPPGKAELPWHPAR